MYLAGFAEPPTVDGIKGTLDEILRGAFTGDLSMALHRAAAIVMLAAYGTAHLADDTATPESSSRQLTESASKLLGMGEALEAASKDARAGALE